MPDQIGKDPPNHPRIEKLKKLQEKLEKVFLEELNSMGDAAEGVTYLMSIRDSELGISMYTGAGCPVCSVRAALQWCIDNDLRHHEDNSPLEIVVISSDTGSVN